MGNKMNRDLLFKIYRQRPLAVPPDDYPIEEAVEMEQRLSNNTGRPRFVAHLRTGKPTLIVVRPKAGNS